MHHYRCAGQFLRFSPGQRYRATAVTPNHYNMNSATQGTLHCNNCIIAHWGAHPRLQDAIFQSNVPRPPSPVLTPSCLQPNDHSDQSLTAGGDRSEGKFNCVDTISTLFVPTKLSHYLPSLVFIPILLHFRELTLSAFGN